jgi:hypothetical protein
MSDQDLGRATLKLSTDGTGLKEGLDKAEKKTSTAFKLMAAAAAAALIKLGKDCFDSFIESERGVAKLTGAIRATGMQSKISVQAITDLASSLQNVTTFSDDATVSAAAMLQQLGGLTERGLKKAIPAVQDFAAAMGMDLESAASLVGKALAGNVGALSRYGIQVKEGSDRSETFANVIKGLNEKFGGMAKELGKTTGGQLVIFKNEVDDLKESLGLLIAQGLNPFLAAVNRHFAVKDLLKIDPLTIASVDDLQAALKVLRDRYAELAVVAKGHGTGLVRPGELAELQNKIEGFERAIVKLGGSLKDAKGNKDTVAGNVGDEGDVETLDKMVQALDNITRNYMAMGRAAELTADKMPQAIENMNARWGKAAEVLGDVGEATEDIVEPTQAALLAVNQGVGRLMQDAANASTKAAADSAQAWQDALNGIQTFLSLTSSAFGQMEAIASQYEQNRLIAIDNELGRKLEALDAELQAALRAAGLETQAVRDGLVKELADAVATGNAENIKIASDALLRYDIEEDFAAKKKKLEDDAEEEKKQLRKDAAEQQKAFSIIGVIISTAQAVMNALATVPFPANLVAAGVMGGLGAAQIALIAAQPIPEFSAGTDFVVPPGYPDDSYPMRVESGERVQVTPAGEGSSPMIHVIAQVDQAVLFDVITRGSRDGRILTRARSVVP